MTCVIAVRCIDVKDKACAGEGPAGCSLRRRADALYPPGECADCGACEPVCPVEAIFCEDDVPGQWAQFTAENARFSGRLGSPGGAAKTGPLPSDTGHVASYVTSR